MGQTFKNTSSDGIFKSNISIISTASSLRIGSPAMIDVTKELPQKTIVVQLEHTEQNSKVPMTAPSGDSL